MADDVVVEQEPTQEVWLPPPGPCAVIVGVGASAGGLEALQRLLAGFGGKAEGQLGVVIVQHSDPAAGSLLAELLGRSSPFAVAEAANDTTILPGHVYVAPPHSILRITRGRLEILPDDQPPGHPTQIDTFFYSLA